MKVRHGVELALLGLVLVTVTLFAQRWGGRFGRGGGWRYERAPLPEWELDTPFKHDVFTFVRIQYYSDPRRGYRGGWDKWAIDFPDADLNFSYRLQQLTSLTVNPEPVHIELTDPTLFDYPFIYIVEPGNLVFGNEEVNALRRYLLNGGFLMVDDFWGEDEWANFYFEMKRVFPNREPRELALEHPIFHIVFPLNERPQIPNVGRGTESKIPGHPNFGITWERPDAQEVHYKGFFDDKDRLMAIICHNTDLGDGWEREGDNEIYFRYFSEKWAYPLGINIVVYAMTH